MDRNTAIEAFTALAQSTRLKVFRRLLKAYPDQIAAGEIARSCSVPHNTMSAHLAVLTRSGLVAVRREGRMMYYCADLRGFQSLVRFLMRDCCNGRTEICAPLLAELNCIPSKGGRKSVSDRVYNVLFLCTGNSARSVMAEAILNREGHGNFGAYSAGSHPKGQVHPYTLDLLRQMKFDVSQFRSKSWSEFARADAPKLDFVFTVCDDAANEPCPYWPGQPMTAHWGLPDPAAATGTEAEIRLAFADAFRMLNNRISIFASLPLNKLDKLALQKHLDAIGKTKTANADAAVSD